MAYPRHAGRRPTRRFSRCRRPPPPAGPAAAGSQQAARSSASSTAWTRNVHCSAPANHGRVLRTSAVPAGAGMPSPPECPSPPRRARARSARARTRAGSGTGSAARRRPPCRCRGTAAPGARSWDARRRPPSPPGRRRGRGGRSAARPSSPAQGRGRRRPAARARWPRAPPAAAGPGRGRSTSPGPRAASRSRRGGRRCPRPGAGPAPACPTSHRRATRAARPRRAGRARSRPPAARAGRAARRRPASPARRSRRRPPVAGAAHFQPTRSIATVIAVRVKVTVNDSASSRCTDALNRSRRRSRRGVPTSHAARRSTDRAPRRLVRLRRPPVRRHVEGDVEQHERQQEQPQRAEVVAGGQPAPGVGLPAASPGSPPRPTGPPTSAGRTPRPCCPRPVRRADAGAPTPAPCPRHRARAARSVRSRSARRSPPWLPVVRPATAGAAVSSLRVRGPLPVPDAPDQASNASASPFLVTSRDARCWVGTRWRRGPRPPFRRDAKERGRVRGSLRAGPVRRRHLHRAHLGARAGGAEHSDDQPGDGVHARERHELGLTGLLPTA